jgi:large subunit ribosomal protein L15
MNVHDVHRKVRKNKKRRRVGRGPGSGWGKTSGRGHKGQGQLAGWTTHPAFEGGQMPLARRIPKRGFHNRFAPIVAAVNVGLLDRHFQGDVVTPEALRACGLVKKRFDALKILAEGEISRALQISAHRFSRAAVEKITKAGGTVTVLPGPAPVVKFQRRPRRAAAKES